MAWAHRWLYEDGLINVRIVENLVNGDGPVFNLGERVEAYTSPAQIAAVAAGRAATFGVVRIEDITFVIGVGAATAGLVLAMLGAKHLWGGDDGRSWSLPIGAVAFAAVPAAWDYATSGHEGGLSYLWIGASLWIIARRARELRAGLEPRVDAPLRLLVVLGSGAMVRPEYLLYSISLGVAWFWLHRGLAGSRLRALAAMASVTVAYEIFRMGYFGLLLSNTAVAKLGADLPLGWHYVNSFLEPYALAIPLLIVTVTLLWVSVQRGRIERAVVLAFVIPAVLQVAYLIQIGGDYVNGRLLLPPLLAFVAPVAVVPSRLLFRPAQGRGWTSAATNPWTYFVGAIGVWAVACALVLRPPVDIDRTNFLDPRFDTRAVSIHRWLHDTPSRRISEYETSFLTGPYKDIVRARAQGHPAVLSARGAFFSQQVTLDPSSHPALITRGIGAVSVLTWPNVHIYDTLGLADPIAAHVPPEGTSPGHTRALPSPWFSARAGVTEDPQSAAAAEAMACGSLATLLDASQEPMSPGRFLSNLVHAPANTFLVVPREPEDAVDEFC